jgi:hypothetical protein
VFKFEKLNDYSAKMFKNKVVFFKPGRKINIRFEKTSPMPFFTTTNYTR